MQTNGEVVEFNKKLIAGNSEIIAKGVHGWDSATAETNAKLIENNLATINKLTGTVKTNADNNEKVYQSAKSNRSQIEANTANIYKRRTEILENRHHITENVSNVVKQLH